MAVSTIQTKYMRQVTRTLTSGACFVALNFQPSVAVASPVYGTYSMQAIVQTQIAINGVNVYARNPDGTLPADGSKLTFSLIAIP